MLAHWWEALVGWWHSIHWDPNWVGAVGQLVGAFATLAAVCVALWLPRWERKRDAAERLRQQRERQLESARLVTIAVPKNLLYRCIEIFNGSDLSVHQPRVDSVSDPRVHCEPTPQRPNSDRGGRLSFHPETLPPRETHDVLYDYCNPDGSEITGSIENSITADDVTITFMDTSRQWWRRTGHGEPERITEPGSRSIL